MPSPSQPSSSPTTSVARVLITVAIAFAVAAVLSAPGIIHAGEGMDFGPKRTATLAVGHAALQLAGVAHLTEPWDEMQAALGRKTQPDAPPLLASTALKHPARQLARVETRTRVARPSATFKHLTRPARQRPRQIQPPKKHQLRRPTKQHPLRLLTTGDSLMGFLGPALIESAVSRGPVHGSNDVHNGTGLTRPDFVDWSVVARQQLATYNPEAIVVLIGGNDFQNMTLPGGKVFIAGTAAWTAEYQRRAEICMRIWTQGGTRHLYWLSVPPARDSSWAYDDVRINLALRRAASHIPGAKFLDILGPVTDHGRYADFVKVNNQSLLVREPDGVHLNITGSNLVSQEVLQVLVRDWSLRRR